MGGSVDAAFSGAGTKPGLKIWRVENFSVVPYPESKYGIFHVGDSYVVLHTRKVNQALYWDIHFWLGAETTQDEAGTAAIKAVELDDSLGGVPVQHREVQEHESSMFLSYFESGVTYLPGGVKSGFTHVDPDAYANRLFQVKGHRNVRVKQVLPNVSAMNKGDSFILDTVHVVYVYMGRDSRRMERLKATSAARKLRDQDHAGKVAVEIIDEHSSDADIEQFFKALGSGSPSEVASAADDDEVYEKSAQESVTLYKVSDDTGKLKVQVVGKKPLTQDMLHSGDCFILDSGGSGIFVWIGRNSSKNEKCQAMNVATKFLKEKGYPLWTKVERIVDGGEPSVFKQYFHVWKEADEQAFVFGRVYSSKEIKALPEEDFDVRKLHKKKIRVLIKNAGKAFGFIPDQGRGKVDVWRVENFQLKAIDRKMYGMFFGGDSYVIKYAYEEKGKIKYIIYFWQGRDSTHDEKASAALHAVRLDNELGGTAIQVRVVQGSEPQHFLLIFHGKMITFLGGHASGFRNLRENDTQSNNGTRLFRVRGTCPKDVRAEQVAPLASSLDSDDAFILETPDQTFIWLGIGCSDEEREMASKFARILVPDRAANLIKEKEEPDPFWKGLGGKGPYSRMRSGECQVPLLGARLFHVFVSEVTHKMRVEEISNFVQEELYPDDVMILDTGAEIYVWIGEGASKEEKEKAMKLAQDYILTEPSERTLDSVVILAIKQHQEPEDFKAFFDVWDENMWQKQKSA